ncbi:hypothetical protein H4O18_17990 [Arenibacter sp. BSSL-BM3]|uniref:HEAT repeat domain-containing protein n=1 Tax=Arenibacter arenosicollis TaxID=2762274 RepID=A0ABR7QS40_9FLAO|nr:hypothetical protein [Arenibacter arenosicollis]MBC8769894.1 hypothetical protein [Arenibacter arenosicollis]
MIKFRFFTVAIIGLLGMVLTSFLQEKESIKYWQVATIESSAADEPLIVETYKATLTNETIFLRKTKDNLPLHYYKKVTGEVCMDQECRLLNIVVYWNITGRYLGFELPKGEFLSKYDHEPFSESEYQRLHQLLADSTMPLDVVSFEKLVEQPNKEQGTADAVSGATSKSVADMVVKGAAYTTYKLWNVINGPTMDIVSELTEKQLTPLLINRILQSPDNSDKLWALNRIGSATELTPDLETSLLEIVSSDDFYLAYSAIQAVEPVHLKATDLQEHLFSMYPNVNHSIQKELLKKLGQAPELSLEVVYASRDLLHQLNGQQLDDLLKLYSKHGVNDLETCRSVVRILKNENKYISKKAYDFLIGLQIDDATIMERLNAYNR